MEKENNILVVDATMENLHRVIDFVEKRLEDAFCPTNISRMICVSLEEIYVNIVNYAYENDVGRCELHTKLQPWEKGMEISISISDRGKSFNPLERENPDITLSADAREIGGLGIFMVKESMDSVSYEYDAGCNILTMVKKWEVEGRE